MMVVKKIVRAPWFVVFCGLAIIILDRITKYRALTTLADGSVYTFNRMLSYELVFNRGISWGVFSSGSPYTAIFITSVTAGLIGLLLWMAYDKWRKGRAFLGEGCIIAGALSNVFDRFVYAGVIDFIHISYGVFSWPLFNVADVSIVIGVGTLLWTYYVQEQ